MRLENKHKGFGKETARTLQNKEREAAGRKMD